MHLERETFGPVLRAARERSGVTLRQLSLETKLSVELWEALEENDLSRWPKRVFARSYVRDYALRVGMDADDVVNEFCRLFPEWGDRRAERVIREKAKIIAHDLSWEDLPAPQRRTSDRPPTPQGFFGRNGSRLLAVFIDLGAIISAAYFGVYMGYQYWPSVAIAAVLSTVLATATVGRSFGLVVSDWLLRGARLLWSTRRLVSSRAQSA